MLEIKRTTKWDGKMKALHFEDDVLVNEDGEIIDLHKHLKAAYGDRYFDFSVTSKEEELIEVDEEMDLEELMP